MTQLHKHATRQEKIEFYVRKHKGEVGSTDIIAFDDAVFFKHADGSYSDHPVFQSEQTDLGFESLDQIIDTLTADGLALEDVMLPGLDNLNRAAKEATAKGAQHFNTIFDVAFSIQHNYEDPANIPVQTLINAMQARVDYLRFNPDEAAEAFGIGDSYEVNEDQLDELQVLFTRSIGGNCFFVGKVNKPCPDCGVMPGEVHQDNCDVERCSQCGGQYLSCGCPNQSTRLAWTGEWPGIQECREFGWYSRRVAGQPGWVSCSKTDPGATEDLNRLMRDAVWSKKLGRFVLPDNNT